MTLADWLPNAALLVIAAFFTAHAPRGQRGAAFLCLAIVALDWLLFVLSWSPYALHFMLKSVGILIDSEDIWPIVDAFAAALIIASAYDHEWAWGLWACLVVEVCIHIGHEILEGPFDAYCRLLDVFFWGQVACFVMIGGRGVGHRIADIVDRLQLLARSPATALAGPEK